MPKPEKIYLCDRKNFYAIKLDCEHRWNIGLLEKRNGSLADNDGRTGSLGDLIKKHGGSFEKIHGFPYVKSPNGASKTCGGAAYKGWVDFGSVGAAIEYLEKYFTICYC